MSNVGAALVAAPFCQYMVQPAHAQGRPGARRLLIFFSPNGTIHRHWRPMGQDGNFAFPEGSILEPLARHRDDLLVLDGINFMTGNNHEGGMAAMLTNRGGGGTQTRGMSLDQYVASQIGGDDRFPSLEFGVLTDPWGGSVQTRMSYQGGGQLVHPDADPRRAFTRMFGQQVGDIAAVDLRQRRRRSVLDLVNGELTDLHRRLGRMEQVKLQAHLQSLRSVEQSLFARADDGGCALPDQPDPLDKDTYANCPALTRSQIDLAVTSLACGLTKVASVQLSHTVSPVVFSWVGNSDGHHSLSHADDAQVGKVADFVNAERWCAEQFAYLLDRMKATPNPDGEGSLLDDTVVLWAKELGDSRAHTCESVPFVMAGSGGGAFRTGRYLRFDGVSHSQLLVSICQAMGLDNDTFGDPSTGVGGLAGLA
jgi:hypothetical protein